MSFPRDLLLLGAWLITGFRQMKIYGRGVVLLFLGDVSANLLRRAHNISFFSCPEAVKIWNWLSTGTDHPLDLSSWHSLLMSCLGRGSTLAQQLMVSAVMHIIWRIWIERNQRLFHDKTDNMANLIQCHS